MSSPDHVLDGGALRAATVWRTAHACAALVGVPVLRRLLPRDAATPDAPRG